MTDDAALHELRIPIDGTPMAGRRGGPRHDADPLPVVLVHGFGMSGTYLLPTARLLARTRHVLVPDLPGHGRSATPPAPLDVPGLADALAAWIAAAGVRRAVLLGNSMGAQVIAEAACRHPGLAAALVLVGPTFDPGLPPVPGLVLRVLADVPRERPSLAPIVARDYARMGVRRLWREFVAMRAHDAVAAVRGAALPTLVVRGEHDPLAPPAWCHALAAAAPDGRMHTIVGAAHAVNHGAAPALTALVERFVGEMGDGARPLVARAEIAIRAR